MRVLLGMFDPHVRRSKAALDHRLRDQFDAFQAQGIDGRPEDGLIDAGVDQGGERHVAADAGRAIEIGNPHGTLFQSGAACGREGREF